MSEKTPDPAAIQAINVVKLFDGGVVRALDGVNLRIERGEFMAITGPSGCGKSTLIHLIAALDVPTSGRILVNGQGLRSGSNDRLRRHEVGLVFQLHNLLPHLNALENVEIAMFANGMGHRHQRERARELLEEMGRHGFPAASGSGWRSRGPWQIAPRSSSPTSLRAASTPPRSTASSPSFAASARSGE